MARTTLPVEDYSKRWIMSDAPHNLRLISEQTDPAAFLSRVEQATPGGDFFKEILGSLPAAVYATDATGRITYFNEAAAMLWGQRPELGKSDWCGSWRLFWPDGRPLPHDQCPMALALKENRPIRGMEAIAERPDGTRVPFVPFPTPIHDASGTLIGAVNMLVDITDRKQTDVQALRLASIVETSTDAIISKDINGIITSWNQGAEQLFGYKAEEMIGKSVTLLIPSDRQAEERVILGKICSGKAIEHYETIRQRKDGSLVEISLSVSPVKDSQGNIVSISKIARDITERRQTQKNQALLVGEMKHRVKNTLTIVQAIASQTFREAPTEERTIFFGRLRALADAQDLLTMEDWSRAQLGEVVSRALAAFQEKLQKRVHTYGPKDLWLTAEKSVMMTMTLHELATNSVKYGALSNESGEVNITWESFQQDKIPRLKLVWREIGGPPVTPPSRRGFGSLLIDRGLGNETGGACIEFNPQGLVCTLDIKLYR